MIRIRTVLFHLPGHPVLLCLLGDFHLFRVPELWRENVGNCHLVMYVAAVCMLCAFLLMFSCLVLAVLTTRLTDSVDHPSTRNTLAVATL